MNTPLLRARARIGVVVLGGWGGFAVSHYYARARVLVYGFVRADWLDEIHYYARARVLVSKLFIPCLSLLVMA